MLERSTTIHELTVVLSALRRYLIIWTCMGTTGAIATALYSAHQVWKSRGLQSRGLLDLLLVVDNNRFLDNIARDHIAADVSAFTHVPNSNVFRL
jgi:mediator of RNA polymerase II transcription subunit 12